MNRPSGARLRSIAAGVLAVLACVSLLLTTISIWVTRTLLDTDSFVAIVDDSLEEPAVTEAVTVFVSRQIVDALAGSSVVEEVIPAELAAAAPLLRAAVTGVVEDQTRRLVTSEVGQDLIVRAVAAAHGAAVAVLKGEAVPENSLVIVRDDAVALDLVPLVARVVERIRDLGLIADGVDLGGIAGVPPAEQVAVLNDALGTDLDDDFGQFVVYERRADDALSTVGAAQRGIELLRRVQLLQVVGTVLLGALALLLARDRRRMVVTLGGGTVAVFVLATYAVRRLAAAVPELAADATARDAVRDVVDRTTESLDTALVRTVVLAVAVAVVAAVLARHRSAPAAD